MYELGQTLYDRKTKNVVLYLGVLKINDEFLFVIRHTDGKIEFIDDEERRKQLTYIKNNKGEIEIGKYADGYGFFGFLGEYTEIYDKFPDVSIKPDNKKYFVGGEWI